MPDENFQHLTRMIEIFDEAGYAAAATVEHFDPDVTFEEPPEQPAPRVAHGLENARQMIGQFDEVWEGHTSDVEEIRTIDDERVLLLTMEHFQGRDGIKLDQPCGMIFTFRDGRVIRLQPFWSSRAPSLPPGSAKASSGS